MIDIEIGQGDSDLIPIILKSNGVAVDLSNSVIIFKMINEFKLSFEIICQAGASVNGVTIDKSVGGVSIPFTPTNTSTPGRFLGHFLVTKEGEQKTYPNTGNSISVIINPI